ncbi:MAG: sulfatase [Verrucomicrobiales bacterium]
MAPVCSAQEAAKRPPNILFLMADDLNTRLGCYGDEMVKSPRLDSLASRGARFDRAYCQFPLCGPSRNSMLTGRYPDSTGIHANSQIFRQTIPEAVSLPQAYRRDGWFAARIGKMYHYNVPKSVGTVGHDDPASWELTIQPAGVDRVDEEGDIFSLREGEFGGTLSWYASPRGSEFHTDAIMAKDAAWVLERCAREPQRPFFLAVGFFRPHTPYVSPKSYFEHYPLEKISLVQGVDKDQQDIPPLALASRKPEQEKLTDDLRRQAIQAYFASITFMDEQVGLVLDSLKRLGLEENTIVVFTSDHGYHLGEHGLWQKQSLFEESARVPLLMAGPGVKPGTSIGAPVGLIDIYPTLRKMTGHGSSEPLQGQNLVPMLEDPTTTGRGYALTQVKRGNISGWSIRTTRWRYIEWDNGTKGAELYDHDNDAGELTNLAADPAHAATLAELTTRLRESAATTRPASGRIPEVIPETWPPNLLGR